MANTGKKKVTVLASGVFDLLHLGHVKFLEAAKNAGGENAKLIVVIARDSTVEKTKGKKTNNVGESAAGTCRIFEGC